MRTKLLAELSDWELSTKAAVVFLNRKREPKNVDEKVQIKSENAVTVIETEHFHINSDWPLTCNGKVGSP